jgi:D-xylose 1-dehydrogenase (NADP+, D-xylono-1,5-lactone-forming)
MKRAKIKWGFLSTAKINDLVLAGARQSDRVDVFAIASRGERRAQEYARANGFERAYGSYEAMLEDPDVEAVYISLPNSLHVEWSVKALEAGKHVLCEKPLDRRTEAVERAYDAAERADRILMEAFMYRFNPQTAKVKELVDGGAVGTPRVIRTAFSFTLTNPENVRLAADLDGGALMDVGCYCVSGSRLIAGEPEQVFGEQVVGPSGVDLRFAGTMRFPEDVIANFDCGFDLPGRGELEVIGSDGSLFVADPWHCRVPGIELRTGSKTQTIAVEVVDSYRLELENLGDATRGEAEPVMGRADAVGQARAIEALYRSADESSAARLSSAE